MQTGGPAAPRPAFGGVARRILRLGLFAVVALAFVWGVGQLPEGTGTGSLTVRALVGLGIGVVVVWTVVRMFRALRGPAAPPPERLDARATEVVYECPICGTRLRLEVASTGKAPRHCGEEMEAQVVPEGR